MPRILLSGSNTQELQVALMGFKAKISGRFSVQRIQMSSQGLLVWFDKVESPQETAGEE
jgi:hypothetical protein